MDLPTGSSVYAGPTVSKQNKVHPASTLLKSNTDKGLNQEAGDNAVTLSGLQGRAHAPTGAAALWRKLKVTDNIAATSAVADERRRDKETDVVNGEDSGSMSMSGGADVFHTVMVADSKDGAGKRRVRKKLAV